MIIDTSALLAILYQEEDAAAYPRTIALAVKRRMSAANFLMETAPIGLATLDVLIRLQWQQYVADFGAQRDPPSPLHAHGGFRHSRTIGPCGL